MAAILDPQQLRVALKDWEHEFFTANGRKPGRADIKSNRDIADKYKLYDKLTRKPIAPKASSKSSLSSTSRPISTSSSPTGSKRKRDSGIGLESYNGDGGEHARTPRRKSSRSSGRHSNDHSSGHANSLEATSSDPYDPPLNEFFSPAAPQRLFVGPTPQKNGKVLGLFDLLSPESARKSGGSASQTPSRSRSTNALFNALTPSKHASIAATPSRARMGPPATGVLTPSRTRINAQLLHPTGGVMSKGTPSTQRLLRLDMDDKTPEFLKRQRRSPAFRPSTSTGGCAEGTGAGGDAAAHGDADADGLMNIQWSPIATRHPRRPIGRSFSEIINANRRVEERRIDDDLDILRELEREQSAQGGNSGRRARVTGAPVPKLQIQDSQAEAISDLALGAVPSTPRTAGASQPLGTDLPLTAPTFSNSSGPDSLKHSTTDITHSATLINEPDLPLGPDGQRATDRHSDDSDSDVAAEVARELAKVGPRRYKKKGPKRQTRKFNIAPVQRRWQPEPAWTAGMSEDEKDGDAAAPTNNGNDEVVPETQFQPRSTTLPLGDVPSDIEALASEYEDEDGDDDDDYGGSSKAKKTAAGKSGKKAPGAGHKQQQRDGPPKKDASKTAGKQTKSTGVKKVSATAHANFRSLKIKNKNSKGKRAGGGRFGRRRGH